LFPTGLIIGAVGFFFATEEKDIKNQQKRRALGCGKNAPEAGS
jgi:hypothetical protein